MRGHLGVGSGVGAPVARTGDVPVDPQILLEDVPHRVPQVIVIVVITADSADVAVVSAKAGQSLHT